MDCVKLAVDDYAKAATSAIVSKLLPHLNSDQYDEILTTMCRIESDDLGAAAAPGVIEALLQNPGVVPTLSHLRDACFWGNVNSVKVLLADARLDVAKLRLEDKYGQVPNNVYDLIRAHGYLK
jgi:hypothetical protein